MRSIKAVLTFVLFFCLSFGTVAQITHNSQGSLDENAAKVLKKASEKMNRNVNFTVTMTVIDSQKKQQSKQSAEVHYNQGRYHLIFANQELISDGKTVWHWNKAAKEVAVNNVGTDDVDLMNPGRLLANYPKAFRAKYIRTDDDGTAVIDLQPRSPRNYHKIRLLINEETGLVKRMEVHKYDSSREVYDITKFKNAVSNASQFIFEAAKHPDVEVIDMR